jgi:hypothetical protein
MPEKETAELSSYVDLKMKIYAAKSSMFDKADGSQLCSAAVPEWGV